MLANAGPADASACALRVNLGPAPNGFDYGSPTAGSPADTFPPVSFCALSARRHQGGPRRSRGPARCTFGSGSHVARLHRQAPGHRAGKASCGTSGAARRLGNLQLRLPVCRKQQPARGPGQAADSPHLCPSQRTAARPSRVGGANASRSPGFPRDPAAPSRRKLQLFWRSLFAPRPLPGADVAPFRTQQTVDCLERGRAHGENACLAASAADQRLSCSARFVSRAQSS